MGVAQPLQVPLALGTCLLVGAALGLAGRPATRPPLPRRYPHFVAPRARPFDAALREAIEWQHQAVDEVAHRQEALNAWNPNAVVDGDPREGQEWRQEVARDRGGYLHRALAQAERAAGLARTRHEICRAGALQAWLLCGLGDHEKELRQARRIMALEPNDPLCRDALRHAARCNGLKLLAPPIDAGRQVLQPPTAPDVSLTPAPAAPGKSRSWPAVGRAGP